MTAYLVPLDPVPQRLVVRLGGLDYVLQTRWNASYDGWVLDLYDVNRTLLVGAIGLVTGVDLMEPYGYLELNAHLYVRNVHGSGDPGLDDLGRSCFLYYVPDGA